MKIILKILGKAIIGLAKMNYIHKYMQIYIMN